MEVRLAHLGDAEAIRRIYNVEVTGSTATFDIRDRTIEEQIEWLEHHSGAHPAVVAVDDGTVCGFGSLSSYKERAAYSTSVEDSVYVDSDWRRKGVGVLLLEELVNLARGHGFHTVIGRIAGGNEASVLLHQRCGFEVIGVEREVGRKFGKWLDVTLVQRLL
ncbi:MAG: N-acetyltransferase family protein [Acidimicrobiales bacterium]|jgi:L-amino acid N-acyltransferase